jgi:hypothetical protein
VLKLHELHIALVVAFISFSFSSILMVIKHFLITFASSSESALAINNRSRFGPKVFVIASSCAA